jgi:phosphatidylserine/phosphatidylglycerophosphate/cardiolipin synthase-like enzyme
VHVKSIVVDGARAYIGSENLSYTSLSKNREVGLGVTDAAAITSIAHTFDADWAAATPF